MWRMTWKNLLARKLRLVMSGLAIVLGVGFLAGVLVFNHGLKATFDNIIEGSTPDATVRPKGSESFSDGSAGLLNATLTPGDVAKLSALPQVRRAAGGVDGFGLSLLGKDDKLVGGRGAPTLSFNYSGIDNMRGEPTLELASGRWPSTPDEIALDANAADTGGYAIGDKVHLIAPFGDLVRTVTLVGTANFNGGGTAGATLVIFDTKGAQDLFLAGKDAYTSVALQAAPGVSQKQLVTAAKAVLPAAFTAVTGDQVVKESKNQVNQFLGVISTFLLVFAIIAVIVGAFIIVNTFSILIAQRVRELALLRALGAGRRQVTRSVLLEAFAMSVVASTLGILVGLGLARGLAALFRAVGLDIAGNALLLTPGTIAACYVVGVLVTLVAAFVPARRAARVPPVAAMREDAITKPTSLRRRTILGAIALVVGAAVAVVGLMGAPGSDAAWVGAGAGIWIITAAVISPVLGHPVLVLVRGLFTRMFGIAGKLAGENALRDPRRTGATASALMIGLALVSTIAVLAASMNKTADQTVNDQFASDYLVQSVGFTPFSTTVGDEISKLPDVGALARQQFLATKLAGKNEFVSANSPEFARVYPLTMNAGHENIGANEAMATAPFAKKHHLHVGSTLQLTFPGNKKATVTVAGISEDTPVTAGLSVPLSLVDRLGLKRQDGALSVNAKPGADKATLRKELDKIVKPIPVVSVQDKTEFAKSIRGQVNQLLYMIYGLLALAIVIAVIGIINTLGLSVIERTREIGLLRSIGLSRPRLRRMITLESVAIAVLGAVLGMALGLVFGTLLRQTLADQLKALGLPIPQLAVFLVIAVIVGVLAALLPAIRASRLRVLDAIATE